MDAFLEPFWNLDQIRGWAETRDPEIIRAAECPRHGEPKRTLEIAIRTTHMATAILRDGRVIVPNNDDPLEGGDELLFVTSEDVEEELGRLLSDGHGTGPTDGH